MSVLEPPGLSRTYADAHYGRRFTSRNDQIYAPGTYNRAPGVEGGYQVLGVDETVDRLYCLDGGNGLLRLMTSSDALFRPTGWSNNKGFPAGTAWYNAQKVLTFKGDLYLLTIEDSSGLPAVYRAVPASGDTQLTWSTALVKGTAGSTIRPSCFSADAQYLYFADYGDPSGGPRVQRSTDGTTWDTVLTLASFRHVHSIGPDPYAPGHVWLAGGDGVAGPNRYSTDYGATFTAVPARDGISPQLTELAFTESDVWGVDDTAYIGAVAIDKATKVWSGVAAGFHANIVVPTRSASAFWDPPQVAAGDSTQTSVTLHGARDNVPVVASFAGPLPAGVFVTAKATFESVTVTLTNTTADAVNVDGASVLVSTAGLQFAPAVFYGAVDTATDILYMTSEQSAIYPYGGLFMIAGKGSAPALLDFGPIGNSPVYLWHGRIFYGPYNRAAVKP